MVGALVFGLEHLASNQGRGEGSRILRLRPVARSLGCLFLRPVKSSQYSPRFMPYSGPEACQRT